LMLETQNGGNGDLNSTVLKPTKADNESLDLIAFFFLTEIQAGYVQYIVPFMALIYVFSFFACFFRRGWLKPPKQKTHV
ncbi:hypothetical protein BDF21DRAFT_331193, partial [Thamnidium elegans]